ncbi:hypothetical protein NX862_16715 [Rhodobacter sp. KR11]|uniref:hypothetical protein n=1 Tax=Rhodobacter sp. KR11 TaxID=2974588 RepID=UPI0022216D74|nr:hypothetical protein [Rhodobacter sp. KR11]MCW1920406.1 hypothetical protein [Rhodobacter sp. KR11]
MSYDFILYAAKPAILPVTEPFRGASLSVSGPFSCEAEDILPSESKVVGARRFMWQIAFEGRASEGDWSRVDAWLTEALVRTKGVLIDHQRGSYQTATKRGELPVGRVTDPCWMTFWFTDGEAFHAHGLARMLETLAEVMPEALPRRFENGEGLQGKVIDGEMKPLLEAFAQDPNLFLKAGAPFGDILMSIPCESTFADGKYGHLIRSHFLLATVSFELKATCDAAALFDRLCQDLDVVYAEITEPLNIMWTNHSWFWRGLPDTPKRALCLGPEYRLAWPEAEAFGFVIGSHLILHAARDGTGLPPPPSDIMAPKDSLGHQLAQRNPLLAPVFPFEQDKNRERPLR